MLVGDARLDDETVVQGDGVEGYELAWRSGVTDVTDLGHYFGAYSGLAYDRVEYGFDEVNGSESAEQEVELLHLPVGFRIGRHAPDNAPSWEARLEGRYALRGEVSGTQEDVDGSAGIATEAGFSMPVEGSDLRFSLTPYAEHWSYDDDSDEYTLGLRAGVTF